MALRANLSRNIFATGNKNHHVYLAVYNAIGQKVSTLIDKDLIAGYYSTSFNALNLSSGVYFYRITVRSETNSVEFQEINKMILMK